MTVESDNAKEAAQENVEKCIRCGMCNELCPVLKVLRQEQNSPRGKAIMIGGGDFETSVFDCTLCKACEERCPVNINIVEAVINARKVLVGKKKEPKEIKEMIKNLEKRGNIFGDKDE